MEKLLRVRHGDSFLRRDLANRHRFRAPVTAGELEKAPQAVFFLRRDFHDRSSPSSL
jgi:hypothetical protein